MRTRKQYRALLDRANGYSALACRMLPALRTSRTAQRSWHLAQAIAARYAAIERRWPVMALLFEQSERTGVSVSNAYHITHPSIFMNPRVILRMLVSQRAAERRAVAGRTPAQPVGRQGAPMTLAATSISQPGRQEQSEVIARILRRAVRDENPPQASVQALERSVRMAQGALVENVASARTPSLARVYRHAAKSKDAAPAVAAAARTEPERSSAVAGRDNAARAAVQSEMDITRITDQVMQTLDRRIVAQRERMGRG